MSRNYNEEMAWRRLQDLQCEMENHRMVDAGGPALRWWLPRLAERVWLVAGLASQRPPRWSPAVVRRVADTGSAENSAGADAA